MDLHNISTLEQDILDNMRRRGEATAPSARYVHVGACARDGESLWCIACNHYTGSYGHLCKRTRRTCHPEGAKSHASQTVGILQGASEMGKAISLDAHRPMRPMQWVGGE